MPENRAHVPMHSKCFGPQPIILISTRYIFFNLKCSKSVKFSFVAASRRYVPHGIRWYTVAHQNNSVNRKKIFTLNEMRRAKREREKNRSKHLAFFPCSNSTIFYYTLFGMVTLRCMRVCEWVCVVIVHFPFSPIGTVLDDNLLYYFSVTLWIWFSYCFYINFDTK